MALEKIIESVLFFLGEPVAVSRLCRITDKKENEVKEALSLLKNNLKDRGLALLEKDGEVFLATSQESSEILKKLQKEELEGELTKAAGEVLSIVIYKNPVTRAEIDYIRGVNSSFVLRNLAVRGLVERVACPHDRRMYQYRPSFDLLRCLGIENFANLPDYQELSKNLGEFLKGATA